MLALVAASLASSLSQVRAEARDPFVRPGAAVIRGMIWLVRCDATSTDISVALRGKTYVTAPATRTAVRFQIGGLSPGIHIVTPLMAEGRCPGGAWMPAAREIDVRSVQDVVHIRFDYIGPAP